jgi:Helix-turn-helix domain
VLLSKVALCPGLSGECTESDNMTDTAFQGVMAQTTQQPTSSLDDLLTTPEAADYLRLSPSTLAKLRVYGTGPTACFFGRAVRYTRQDLDAFRDSRRDQHNRC